MTRVCIIGAGCSGITTAKRLRDHGIDYDQFELSDDVGGNWYFKNPNGRSAVYESLHIDTSKTRLQFEDYPVPEEWPDFPSHRLMHDYFRAYVEEFGLRDGIEFGTGVERAVRRPADARVTAAGTSPSRPARPAATPTSSSPTGTTGPRGSAATTRASSTGCCCTATTTSRRSSRWRSAGSGWSWSAWATPRWTSPASCPRPGWPRRSTSPRGGECGCCRSTATDSRPTR